MIATGSLGVGSRKPLSCDFPIVVPNVPKSDFYTIEVGHRGELTYSFAEMVAQNWTVGFTLGN